MEERVIFKNKYMISEKCCNMVLRMEFFVLNLELIMFRIFLLFVVVFGSDYFCWLLKGKKIFKYVLFNLFMLVINKFLK